MKKRILSLLGIIALFLGVILVSCGNDDDNKNTTGVHKIVIEQSGNTDDFDLNIIRSSQHQRSCKIIQ